MTFRQSRRARGSSEEGVALLLVLAFVVVIGVVVAALLGASGTTFVASSVVRNNEQRVYRVDSGIEYGLQLLRSGPSFCLTPSGTSYEISLTIDGGPVTVSCSLAPDSSAVGTAGWAVFVKGGSISNSQPGAARIVGNTYLEGSWGTDLVLDVVAGHVVHRATGGGTCTPGSPPNFVKPYPLGYPYGVVNTVFTCASTSAPTPTAPPVTAADEPLSGGTPVVNPPSTTQGTCRVFSPGVYTKKPALGSMNYFRSGVYVLAFNAEWKIDKFVTGGLPWADPEGEIPGPAQVTGIPAADSACPLPGDTVRNGVRWLLSGSSRLKVGSNGKLELYPLVDSASPERPSGTLQALTAADTASWVVPRPASTLTATQSVLKNDKIANTEIGIHGVLFAPNANLLLNGDVNTDGKKCQTNGDPLTSIVRSCNNSVLKVVGSAVVADLDMNVTTLGATSQPELKPGKLGVDNVAGSGYTRFVLTAASPPAGGGRTVKAIADVALYNTSPISLRVESWRVTNS